MPSLEMQLKEQIDESIKLTRKMLDTNEGLEARIKAIEEKGGGAADLKEQVNKMATDNAKAVDEIKSLTEKLRQEVTDRQDEFETKMQGRFGGDGAAVDFAEPFIKSVNAARPSGSMFGSGNKAQSNIAAKSLLFGKTVTSLAASAGDAQVPVYEREIVAPGQQAITLLDVLPRTMSDSPLIYWVEEVLGSRTNGVAIQSLDFTGTSQGTALGTSDFVFNQKSAETRTFGHKGVIALQVLEDVAQLRGYIENQMRYMVRYDLEDQILNGAGTGTNFSGLKTQATAYSTARQAGVTNLQRLDVLRYAVLQGALTFFPSTAMILHPADSASLELIKDTQGRYIFVNNPNAGQTIRPWGVPVVASTQQTETEFTVGAMNQVELVIRKDIEVAVSTEDSDNFQKLLATMRAYGRFGLKVYQAGAIIDGDFDTAIT